MEGLLEFAAGVGAQAFGEHGAGPGVDPQGLALAPGPVEGDHLDPDEGFAFGVVGRDGADAGGDAFVFAPGQGGVEPPFGHPQELLVQARHVLCVQQRRGDVGQDRAAPQAQGVGEEVGHQ